MEFKKIRAASRKEHRERLQRDLQAVKDLATVAESWYYSQLLTEKQRTKTEAEKKAIIIAKIEKKAARELTEIEDKIARIEQAPDLLGVNLSVEWTPSRVWGMNPQAVARIHTSTGWINYQSGKIGGCGYDKESTATANALNQSESVLKVLYTTYERALKKNAAANLHEVLGYGSGYGCRPYIEGGCGVNCLYLIFDNCGMKFEQVGSGKMFNSYTISKQGGKQ